MATKDSLWLRETEFKGRVSRVNRMRARKCLFESFSEGKTKIQKRNLVEICTTEKLYVTLVQNLYQENQSGAWRILINLFISLHAVTRMQIATKEERTSMVHRVVARWGTLMPRGLYKVGRTGQSCGDTDSIVVHQ